MKNKKRFFIPMLCIIVVLIVLLITGIRFVHSGFYIQKPVYLYVHSEEKFDTLKDDVRHVAKVKHPKVFSLLTRLFHYPKTMKTGRYIVKPGMTIWQLVQNLRRGQQTPVKLTFNNIRTKLDLSYRLSEQLMLNRDSLFTLLNDSAFCSHLGFNTQNVVAMFIPNTYQVYWDISVKTLLNRMDAEYKKFWNKDRVLLCQAMGITPIQVSTLASIVEEECTYSDEYPIVAGLYLNRLATGHLLQADPTVKFAVGNFALKRILNKDLKIDSPYNTYIYKGLPPGPIRIPSIKGIESVLHYKKTDYFYMCAKEDFSGHHNFAVTMTEHLRNAQKYRQELNKRHIY